MASRKQGSPARYVELEIHASRIEAVWAVVLEGKRYAVGESPVLIGRAADCQIRVDHEAVAEHHAELTAQTWDARLRDLGSATGTWVDGERISERALRGRERIVVGAFAFHIVLVTRPVFSDTHEFTWFFSDYRSRVARRLRPL